MSGLMDSLVDSVSSQVVGTLPEEAKQRVAALLTTRAVMPDADATDRILLARYVLTGQELPQEDPYPYVSGDVTTLGPQIFASTTYPAENTVINWQGENFVPQRDAFPHGPLPEGEPGDPDLAYPPDLSGAEPAASEGPGWQGHHG
jgi:hypothetical protein